MKDRKIYCLNSISPVGTDSFRPGYALTQDIQEAAGVMSTSQDTYPVVIMANGTGVKASHYKEVFKHLSSWGFIVAGNEDENSRTGASSEATLEYLITQNSDSNSIFYHKLNLEHIGIGGHSQGGVGAVNAVTQQKNGNMPMEQMDCVTTPQNGPGPVTRIQTSAQTREGIVRTSRIRARKMTASHFGTILVEARKLTGIDRMPPMIVPSTAIAIVCSVR